MDVPEAKSRVMPKAWTEPPEETPILERISSDVNGTLRAVTSQCGCLLPASFIVRLSRDICSRTLHALPNGFSSDGTSLQRYRWVNLPHFVSPYLLQSSL